MVWMSSQKTLNKKAKEEKIRDKSRGLSIIDDLPRIDWDSQVPAGSPVALAEWHNLASDAIKHDDLELFKTVLRSVTPISFLGAVFQCHREDFSGTDLIKLAITHGSSKIVDACIQILNEPKFYAFAKWGNLTSIHLAAIWGHTNLVESMLGGLSL